jgi:hypothetical protein
VHEDVIQALEASRDEAGSELAGSLLRPLTLSIVPLGVAILAAMVHRDYEALLWPPSPILLLAPLVTYTVLRRVSRNDLEIGVTAALSGLIAFACAWGIAIVLGIFEALTCLGPNGGCLPW